MPPYFGVSSAAAGAIASAKPNVTAHRRNTPGAIRISSRSFRSRFVAELSSYDRGTEDGCLFSLEILSSTCHKGHTPVICPSRFLKTVLTWASPRQWRDYRDAMTFPADVSERHPGLSPF